jgi:Lectin C-type domain
MRNVRKLFGTVLLCSSSQAYCQADYVAVNPHNGNTYYSSVGEFTWSQAQSWAQGLGGNLVTINSPAEQAWLEQTFGTQESFWIGLHQVGGPEPDGSWEWVSGQAMSYTNWQPGKPDNNDSRGAENCALFQQSPLVGGEWDDKRCDRDWRAIAEVETGSSNFGGIQEFATTLVSSTNAADFAATGSPHPEAVLGAPDGYVEHFNGPDGQVTVGFAGWGADGGGDDLRLYIRDFCDVREDIAVEVSSDGTNWTTVATFAPLLGQRPSCESLVLDIDVGAAGVAEFQFVRLSNLSNVAPNDDGGDFDAVAILYPFSREPDYPSSGPTDPIVKHLIFVTHGWISSVANYTIEQAYADFFSPTFGVIGAWESRLEQLGDEGVINPDEWEVRAIAWGAQAQTFLPISASRNALNFGQEFGDSIDLTGIESIHFIGASAGSHLIERAANRVMDRRGNAQVPRIHTTFLDPFIDPYLVQSLFLGYNSDWSENYFTALGVHDLKGGLVPELDITTGFTGTPLLFSYNLVLDHSFGQWTSDCGFGSEPGAPHFWPVTFYRAVVREDVAGCDLPLAGWPVVGYETSEADGTTWPDPNTLRGPFAYVVDGIPARLGSQEEINAIVTRSNTTLDPTQLPVESSTNGTVSINPGSIEIGTDVMGANAWVTLVVQTDDIASWIGANIRWTGDEGSRGVLRASINGIEVAFADQQVDFSNGSALGQDFTMPLVDVENPFLAEFDPGVFTLKLTLDSFSETTPASVVIEGLSIGRTYQFDADVNQDGVADIEDAYSVLNTNSDLDDDGSVDQADIQLLLKWLRRSELLDMDSRQLIDIEP